jgi:signal transduction histidine kinase
MAQLIPIADKRNIELELIAPADVQWDIAIVPEWIEVLVDNLIGNAIHYGPSDALIQVHINIENTVDKGEVIQLEISDLGAGIVEREPVFERFYRGKAHNEQARADHKKNGDGVGLGLSIVQKIVHLHGGQVSICPRSSTTPFSMRVQLPKEGKIESPLFDKA